MIVGSAIIHSYSLNISDIVTVWDDIVPADTSTEIPVEVITLVDDTVTKDISSTVPENATTGFDLEAFTPSK